MFMCNKDVYTHPCLISTQGDVISCGCVTICCLCGSVAVWDRREAASRHSADAASYSGFSLVSLSLSLSLALSLSRSLPLSLSLSTVWKAARFFKSFSTRGHVIYQMNGPLFWTVEPVTVYHATRQVSPQYYFSLQRPVFSGAHLHTFRVWHEWSIIIMMMIIMHETLYGHTGWQLLKIKYSLS